MDILAVVYSRFQFSIAQGRYKNPDKYGPTLKPLIVEKKVFQIQDQWPWKLVARELTKYSQLTEEIKLQNSQNSPLTSFQKMLRLKKQSRDDIFIFQHQ